MPDRKTRSIEAALEEAKRQFSTKAYEEVSVNEIATIAQCSTTTIYDVFGNKMGLYVAAARDYVANLLDEIEAHEGGRSALEKLINHLELLAERFATPGVREMVRNVIARISSEEFKATPDMRAGLVKRYAKLIENVQSGIEEGVFRPYPAHYITDIMLAHIGWRPLFHGLLLGSNDPLNFSPAELAWRSLMTVLTEKGRREYAALRPALTQLIESMP
jgi:AcrR family transcriptional regulator